jgi:hypothetical protein
LLYSFSVSGVGGSPGQTLTWDLSLTAGSTEGAPFLPVDGGPNRGWVVTSQNSTRFETNETLTFVVSNVLLDGGVGATFTGFTGYVADVNPTLTEDLSTPGTYVLGGTELGGTASRLRTISFAFDIAGPESSIPLTITPNSPASRFKLDWESQAGMLYDVVVTTPAP